MDIGGAVAIVTGGSSGLGAATVRLLTERGAAVAIFDVNNRAREVADETGALFCRCDVSSSDQVTVALDEAEAAHGIARILVNCAGVAPAERAVTRELLSQPIERYRRVIEINLVGSFITLSQFAARVMRAPRGPEEDQGVIINTASVAAFDGQIGHAAYSASKAGLVGMGLPLAREFARAAIRVMTIAPGIFETPILAGIQNAADALAARVLYPARMGKPDEFATLIAAIVANPMLNGECIRLDGAVRMPPR